MAEIQIKAEIEKLKDLASNGIEGKELDEAKSILEVIKSGKASKEQLEEIIKLLDNEVRTFQSGNFVAVNVLNGQKEDFEKLLSNYNTEKQIIVDESVESAQYIKGTIVKPIENEQITLNKYNERFIKKFEKRINDIISKFDENNEAQKKLKEELGKLLANPSNSQVELIQNIIVSLGGKVSKSGNPDSFFGPKTMKALESIVGIETIDTPKTQKKGKVANSPTTKKSKKDIKTPNTVIKNEIKTVEIKYEIAKNEMAKNVKASDGSLMIGEFTKNEKGVRTLYNGTRKFKDGRVDIYEKGEKKDYMMEYMALMAVMIGVDLAGFTGVGTIPSLVAGTGYDIYDLTQKEDAGWQALKKMGLVDKRYYAGDKGILEYSLNALGLIPGMTAVAKGYKIQKFYKGLSAAEKAEFNKLESFMKDRFFGIGEVSAAKGKIGQEYSKEANDLRKAREKAAKEKIKTKKTAETISDDVFETFTKTGKIGNDILASIANKIKNGEKISDRELSIQQNFGKEIEQILKKVKNSADEGVKSGEKIEKTIIKGDELKDVAKDLEKKYGKEKARKIMEKLLSSLNGLKKVKNIFPEALRKDVDNGLGQFIKDIFLSKWNLVGAGVGAGIDQFLLDDYVDGVDRMELFLKSLFIGYLAGTAFNIAGKGLKYTLSGTGAVGKFIWKHKGKLILGGIGSYIACERTNYNSFSEMFEDWLRHNPTGGNQNPTPTYTEETEFTPEG